MKDIYDCDAYACYLTDEDDLMKSTSGGAFYGIAKNVISQGGIVFGAVAASPWEVVHKGVSDLEGLDEIRKSKYVQSRIGQTYIEAQQYLLQDKWVLFSGTPCQIAGLKAFLGKDYERLLTIDVICHGVPNSEVLRRHIEHLEEKYGKIRSFGFRDKKNGWSSVTVKYELEKENVYAKAYDDAYFFAFDHYLLLRPSCYTCQFREMNSGADITIGDYWGIQDRHPEFWNENGISAVILKTEKGKRFFTACLKDFTYIKTDVEKIAIYNIFVLQSRGRKKTRDIFFDLWKQGEADYFKICDKVQESIQQRCIGIVGSYSARRVVNRLISYDEGVKIAWHITNSALCSMMAERRTEYNPTLPADINEYRRSSILCDVHKDAVSILEDGGSCDFVIVDLLEERYPLYIKDSCIVCTKSDALEETGEKPGFEEWDMLDILEQDWRKACQKFLDTLLSVYRPEQIILLRLLLTENYGRTGIEGKFAHVDKIQEMNLRLEKYYDFIEQSVPGIHIVKPAPDSFNFCDKKFMYGCRPEYYNFSKYEEIKDAVVAVLEKAYE